MKLREFVRESLVEIVNGVKEAQVEAKKVSASICPRMVKGDNKGIIEAESSHGWHPVDYVDFDIGVTVDQHTKTDGGIKVDLVAMSLGSSGESHNKSDTAHRVKFRVPIILPICER